MPVDVGPGRREVDSSALVSTEMNRLRGRLCGLIESWDLDERRERAMIQTLKALSYDSERVLKELVEE
jgi:hypothetical protein